VTSTGRRDAALAAVDRIRGMCAELGARRVGMYSAIDGELDVEPTAAELRRHGLETWYPAVVESSLTFRRWNGTTERTTGRYGIAEPPLGPSLDIAELDVVIVPLVAFDLAGDRLGFGAGYYDRALGMLDAARRPTTVGVAYDFQELALWEPESHDVALDFVITPTRTLRCHAHRDRSGGGGPVG